MSPSKFACALAVAACLSQGPALAQEVVPFASPAHCQDSRLLIGLDEDRALSFQVEVADTPEKRARGLMFRTHLPAGQGMLFVYERPQPVSFWMRNTLIPLDMVFIDEIGVIRHIHRNATPLDETPIPGAAAGDPAPDRLMVLELAGGEAARLGLKSGQPVAHPALLAQEEAWPCA
ncbi:MAG: DUF192 domain-containing protein [Paracoccus sp. (in: a-proteobacteria)]|uniref:DUF192 domain-containing protein n=1 Tax=Paracoccus sp. TaxID=267 RepID=UPI002E891E19|nr:DUF192 domain-containing protein [Pseudomonadota bacterium]